MTHGPDKPAAPIGAPSTVSAMRWTLAGNVAQRLVTLGAVAALARLLTETEYGAYRLLLAVHLVLFVVLPLGFDQLYIREVLRRRRMTMLLAGALAGSCGFIALAGIAGHVLWVRLMDFSPWASMLWMAPAVVGLQAAKYLYKTDLAARLAFRDISLGETLYATVNSVGGVALALAWPTAWSLYVAFALAEVAELFWLRSQSRVTWPPLGRSLRAVLAYGARWRRFGVFHCGNQVLNAVGSNAPTILLGSAFSKAAAAAFSMGNWLVTVPIYILIGALHRVAFSALAGRDRPALAEPVLQMLRLSSAFIVPVLVWVAVMAEPIVYVALGEKWIAGTAPVARLLAMYCVFAALFSPVSVLDVLLDRPDYGFWWNVVATILRTAAVAVGLRTGVMEAILYYSVVSAVMWVIWGAMLAHLLGAGQWRFHSAWLSAMPLWVFLGLLLAVVRLLVTGSLLQLMASAIPVLIYAGLVWKLLPATAHQGMRVARRS